MLHPDSVRVRVTGQERNAWELHHDDSVRIGFKRDFGSVWVNRRQVHTDRLPDFHISGLLKNFSTPHVMGGPNVVQCDNCQRRCENERCVVLGRPSGHLMLTITRMKYDAKVRWRWACAPPRQHVRAVRPLTGVVRGYRVLLLPDGQDDQVLGRRAAHALHRHA